MMVNAVLIGIHVIASFILIVFVLLHAAVSMILHDPSIGRLFHTNLAVELLLSLAATGLLIGLVRLMERGRHERQQSVSSGSVVPRSE